MMRGKSSGRVEGRDIEAKCLQIYRSVLTTPDLEATDEFAGAGGDSIKAVLIATELESTFGIEVTMETFYGRKNVAEIVDWLTNALTQG